MKFSQLDQWLCWLESLHATEIDLGLERIVQVANTLNISSNLAHSTTQVITVAGTNGKGSCIATLAACLKAQGKSYGAYTLSLIHI